MYGNNNNPAPGTAGGRCLPSVMIRGQAQPRCAAPSRCDTNDGSSTFDKCMLPARRPIPRPPGLRSYECNPRRGYDGGGPDCIARDDGNGRYKTMAECNSKCGSARLRNPTYMCNPDRNDMLGSKACITTYDGRGMYKSEAECEKHCGAATLRTGYSCPPGTKIGGGACVKVAGIPGNRGVFGNPTSCSEGSNCHAQPTSLMRDPYWSIGSVEPDPLMFMMSNVGDVGDRIQNFMGE